MSSKKSKLDLCLAFLENIKLLLHICTYSQSDLEYLLCFITLESGIDVGQGISVGPGKFAKKNKRRALNKRRASDF